jgi:four helix bundle protein
MAESKLRTLSMDFAVSVVTVCEGIKGKSILTNQLLRSGTSIGANIHEAGYAQSRPDFISKMQIALKECYETEYWLELFARTHIVNPGNYEDLKNKSGTMRRMLIATIKTSKGVN